ncbi:MAG: Eco57I restriction-modification methylase domain-containing protein [Candidatus Thorarchaeota archaeon]|jgi:hypothetical protein
MTATMFSKFEEARIKFRDSFSKGIKPVDGRQPIPDELALAMIQELDLPKDAFIGVFDAFLILSTHLKEAGYTNIVLLENDHRGLTSAQEQYYNKVKALCEKSGIKYYVPPMNNYNRCDMKFDVIIGNPPYNSDRKIGNQSLRGGGNKSLWMDFVKKSFDLVKDNGIVSLITPTGIFCGGDRFTNLLIGEKAKYDLNSVDFSASQHFKGVGINMIAWSATKSKTETYTTFNDRDPINVKEIVKLIADPIVHQIYETLASSNVDKFNFDMTGQYNVSGVAGRLRKQGLDESAAGDYSKTKTETHQYPVNCNGTIKYTSVKWDYVGTPKILIPQMKDVGSFEIIADDVMVGDQSTLTHFCESVEESNRLKDILDLPITRWIIEQGRLNGRLGGARLSILPKVDPTKVLTADQLSYIQSQLS